MKLYSICLTIAYIAHRHHPYIESLPTLWYSPDTPYWGSHPESAWKWHYTPHCSIVCTLYHPSPFHLILSSQVPQVKCQSSSVTQQSRPLSLTSNATQTIYTITVVTTIYTGSMDSIYDCGSTELMSQQLCCLLPAYISGTLNSNSAKLKFTAHHFYAIIYDCVADNRIVINSTLRL